MTTEAAIQSAIDWVESQRTTLSDWHATVWDFHEPAWREYRSAAWYVALLREQGFEVEAGSGGMPTAFCATWSNGDGPTIGSYAEYDAVPGNNQDRVPFKKLRDGIHRAAAGHTDPHSALGISALGGVLAAKAEMEKHGIKGRLKFLGEPAEKVCGSKPVHAAKGYYDDMDAAVSFHPSFGTVRANTAIWDTHCGSYWSAIYTFECEEPETWKSVGAPGGANAHTMARAPGANDALCLMYTTTKYTKESMLPHTGTWTLNEAILGSGDATADNLAPRFSQIQYSWRAPTLAMQQRIAEVLDNNAEHVAAISHCTVIKRWETKTRVGLPNHAMAEVCYRNLEKVGAPVWDEEAYAFCREIQESLGVEPMEQPVLDAMGTLCPPEAGEAQLRAMLPPWQINYTSDDYVDWTWHTPTVRLIVGRCGLKAPQGYDYPNWAWNAMGGFAATIDPTIFCAAKTIGATIVDLMTSPDDLQRARDEFNERTGGGIGGSSWVPPLLPPDFDPPIGFHWPEYVETVRGREWYLPDTA